MTVAVPVQCGVIRSRTAPVCTSERSASTSYVRSVARPSDVVQRSDVRTSPHRRNTVWRYRETRPAGVAEPYVSAPTRTSRFVQLGSAAATSRPAARSSSRPKSPETNAPS